MRGSELSRHRDIQLQNHDFLLSLSPQEFEAEVARLFRKLCYAVKLTPYSNDRGKDAIATKDGKKYVIECKRYAKDKRIGRPALQKFFAAMHEEQATKGFFVTTSAFADTAISYAKVNNIELVDATALISLMNEALGTPVEADNFQAICLECGEVLIFSLSKNEVEKSCRCGCLVNKDDSRVVRSMRDRSHRSYRRRRWNRNSSRRF